MKKPLNRSLGYTMETKKDEIKTDKLTGFLGEIDKELNRGIQLNAVGGTAMTLLGLKKSTIDVDFDMNSLDKTEFERVLGLIPHGFKVDRFVNGLIFSQQLPEDYLSKLIKLDVEFKKIRLYALHPVDIVATKIGRLDGRDLQDIESCINSWSLKKEGIEDRAKHMEICGSEKVYKQNLKVVIKKFF